MEGPQQLRTTIQTVQDVLDTSRGIERRTSAHKSVYYTGVVRVQASMDDMVTSQRHSTSACPQPGSVRQWERLVGYNST